MHWVHDEKGNAWIFDDNGNCVKGPNPIKLAPMFNPNNGATAEPEDIEHLKKRIESHLHLVETQIEQLKALEVRLNNNRSQLIKSLEGLHEQHPDCNTADSENKTTEDQRQAENKTIDVQNEAIGDRKV